MWVILSLLGSLAQACQLACNKKGLTGKINAPITLFTFTNLVSALILSIFLLISGNDILPKIIEWKFSGMVIIIAILNTGAQWFLLKALTLTDLGFLMPFTGITVIVNIIPSEIMFNELPTLWGIIGILLIITDITVLIKKSRCNRLEKNGLLFFLGTLTCWSIIPVFWKTAGITGTAPLTVFSVHALTGLMWLIILFFSAERKLFKKQNEPEVINYLIWALSSGVFFAIGDLAITQALIFSQPPYVYAVKRTAPIWGALIGFIFLKEKKNFKLVLWCSLGTTLGVVLITLLG